MVRILDLYCGMGGLSLGFALAIEGMEILGLDIDRDAVATYNLNLARFGCKAVVQDVLVWKPVKGFDIVVGGSPCQPFSLANSRRKGEQHPLFPTFPRFFDLVLEIEPKVFVLENVKGLLTARFRPLLEKQLDRVRKLYRVAYRVLNSAHYGVPQRRERLFVIGIRKDLGIEPSFPEPTHGERETVTLTRRVFRWVTVAEAIGDLLALPPSKVPDHEAVPLTMEQVERIRREREDTTRHFARMTFPDPLDMPSRTISSHTVEGTKRETIVVPVTEHVLTATPNVWNSDWGKRTIPLTAPSYTITEKHRSGQLVESAVGYRRLTVRECLRLQSFPDWWRFPSNVSISKKYKLVGEAVPPILAYRLAIHVAKLLGWRAREPPRPEEWCLPYFDRAFQDYFE